MVPLLGRHIAMLRFAQKHILIGSILKGGTLRASTRMRQQAHMITRDVGFEHTGKQIATPQIEQYILVRNDQRYNDQ